MILVRIATGKPNLTKKKSAQKKIERIVMSYYVFSKHSIQLYILLFISLLRLCSSVENSTFGFRHIENKVLKEVFQISKENFHEETKNLTFVWFYLPWDVRNDEISPEIEELQKSEFWKEKSFALKRIDVRENKEFCEDELMILGASNFALFKFVFLSKLTKLTKF